MPLEDSIIIASAVHAIFYAHNNCAKFDAIRPYWKKTPLGLITYFLEKLSSPLNNHRLILHNNKKNYPLRSYPKCQ